MFASNCWYVAATSGEVSGEAPHACELAGLHLVLYRKLDGQPVAMDNQCAHRLAPLSLGRIEGNNLRCMYHGICFDERGDCIDAPGLRAPPKSLRQKSYPAVEQNGWIWHGEAELADIGLLPSTAALDPEHWHVRYGDLHLATDYQLVNDNLCDLSHSAYVHRATFGQFGEDQWVVNPVKTTPIDRGVRVERWIVDALPPSYLHQRVDSWVAYDYVLPGVFLMKVLFFEVGTAAEAEYQEPKAGAQCLHVTASTQAVTPLSVDRSRYFFASSIARSEPEEWVEGFHQLTQMAFAEDKAMLEAQQKMISQLEDPKLAATKNDEAAVRFRRLIEQSASAVQPAPPRHGNQDIFIG